MLCARVVRGAASSANAVQPCSGQLLQAVAVERVEHAHQHCAGLDQVELVGQRGHAP